MPNIREFTANAAVSASERGLNVLQPTERGSSAMANLARTEGAMGERVGRSIEQGISSVGQASVSAVNNYLTQRDEMRFNQQQPDYWSAGVLGWKKFAGSTDITDAQAVEQFNENLVKQDQDFLDSFTTERGKQLAMNEVRRRRDHMTQVQMADVSTRTGEQAVNAVLENVNKSGAIVQRDPHFLEIALRNTDDMVARLKANPNLTEEQRAGFDRMGDLSKRNLAKTAFLTMAEANPKAARAELEAGWQNKLLKPEDRDELLKVAEVYQRRQDEEGRAAAIDADKKEREAANTDMNELLFKHVDTATGELTDISGFLKGVGDWAAKHPAEAPGAGRAAVDYARQARLQAENGTNIVDDPTTRQELESNILLPPGDPNRPDLATLYRAGIDRKLSTATVNRLIQMRANIERDPGQKIWLSRVSQAVNGFKSAITHSDMMGHDSDGDQAFTLARHEVDLAVDAARAAGTLPELLDRGSPNYIGRIMEPYFQPSSKEQMQRWLDRIKTGSKLLAPPTGAPAAGGEKSDAVKWLEEQRARQNKEK